MAVRQETKDILRDSESEDFVFPSLSRINLIPDAFFENMHDYMQDNIRNYREQDIRDQLSNFANLRLPDGKDSIKTVTDLESYVSRLISEQFGPEEGDQKKNDSNVTRIIPILDIIVAELHGKGFHGGSVRGELRSFH